LSTSKPLRVEKELLEQRIHERVRRVQFLAGADRHESLDAIARGALGVGLEQVTSAF
jgi:hypothetical protein